MSVSLIFITPTTFDTGDALKIESPQPSINLAERSRRVTRTSTLDGSVVYQDFGSNQGDLDYSVTIRNVTRAQVERLQELWAYSQLWLRCQDGAYTIRPESYEIRGGNANLKFYVESRLDV